MIVAMWIILWMISIIIFVTGPKSAPNRYASFILFFFGTGLAAKVFRSFVIPVIANRYPSLLDSAIKFDSLLFSLSTYLPPYFMLTYAIAYSNIIRFKNKTRIMIAKIVFFIPVVLMFVFVPFASPIPSYNTDYILLSVWTIPYMIFSYALIVLAYLRENIKSVRLIRLVNMIYIIPVYTLLMFSEVILPLIKYTDRTFLYFIIILYLIICIAFLALKSDFFGLRIVFEKNKSIYENRIYNSGISMLNHSMKNEISKISLCATYLNEHLIIKDENIDIIIESSSHLLSMINKLNFQAREINLNNEYIKLKDLINEVVVSNKILIDQKNIAINQNIDENLYIFCDKIHFKELINNILNNSIEAIENTGNINIQSFFQNKYLVIVIKDNGCGILETDMKNITEPFFSTKGNSQNYGMGLYYCKKVIDKHGGFIGIKSKVGSGTEVSVNFPQKGTCYN